MKVDEFCTYGAKSGIKAGDATFDGQYMFFTSSEDERKRYTDYQFDGEGIIMGIGGNATLHYYQGKYAVSTDCIVLTPDDRVKCKYLYYFFLANMPLLEAGFKGAGLKHTNKKYIGNIELRSIPSPSEQDGIIGILDRVARIIQSRKDELSRLDDLIKARFVELFGDSNTNNKEWPILKLSEICDVGSSKRIYQEEQSSEGVAFWRISDLVNMIDNGMADSGLFIPETRYEELKEQGLVPDTGDILVTSRGTLGKCYIVNKNDRFYFQDGMISWLHNYKREISPLYVKYLFITPGILRQIEGMHAGSTVAYLSITMLKNLDIMLPDNKAQESFECFVAQVDKSKVAIQKALDETQLLFDSLMQQYFG